MLSSTALMWTAIVAAVCWFVAVNQIYALWKMVGDKSSQRYWSVTPGKIEPKGKGNLAGTIVFLVVFAAIAGILTAHAIAGKMIMMSNGLPMFALVLPSAALLVAAGSFAAYFVQRRERKASASWPTTQGQIVCSRVVEKTERSRDDDGDERESTTYRPDIRFAYRVDGTNYATDTWKPGGFVGSGSPKYAEKVAARYAAGQSVSVFYNPAHPDVAVLEPGNRDGAAIPLAFGVVFGLAGALFMWLFTRGHWVNAATGV